MGIIITIIQKNSKLLLTVFLLLLALWFTINRNVYHSSAFNSAFFSMSASVSNSLYKTFDFASLHQRNDALLEENKKLKLLLFQKHNLDSKSIAIALDSNSYNQTYELIPTQVIRNSIINQNNFIFLDKGLQGGIRSEMGLISENGIIGIVTKTNNDYAEAISILNSKTRINARIKHKEYFGTLYWSGDDSRIMNLSDIPKFVSISIGDTIETDGKANRFPEGISVGRISGYNIDKKTGNWDIFVELFQDMSKINNVYAVKNLKRTIIQPIIPKEVEETTAADKKATSSDKTTKPNSR